MTNTAYRCILKLSGAQESAYFFANFPQKTSNIFRWHYSLAIVYEFTIVNRLNRTSTMRNYRSHDDVMIERLKNDLEYRHAYLQVAVENFQEDGESHYLLLALRNVAEAQGGVPTLAKKVNMGKTSLYKALSEDGNPRLDTIYTILGGLGYKIQVVPVDTNISYAS